MSEAAAAGLSVFEPFDTTEVEAQDGGDGAAGLDLTAIDGAPVELGDDPPEGTAEPVVEQDPEPASAESAADGESSNGEAEAGEAMEPKDQEPQEEMVSAPVSELEELDRFREHDQELKQIADKISDIDVEIEQQKEELKELKSRKDVLVTRMGSLIRDFDARQLRLPFGRSNGSSSNGGEQDPNLLLGDDDDSTSNEPLDGSTVQMEPGEDPAKGASLVELVSCGLTQGQCEKWQAADIDTVADLEKAMREDRLAKIARETKGLGQKAIDRISDALFEWRKENPMPEAG